MKSAVEIQSLVKTYNNFKLGPLDLTVEEGMVVALLGSNGSGKSTLLQTIMKLKNHDYGNVKVLGMDINEHEVQVKERIGYAGGGLYGAFNQLTVDGLAELVGHWYTNWDQAYYERLINRYDINRKEKFAHCSMGTKKKVEFILAMAHHPKLLLLDEPTANVDMISQQRMREDLSLFMADDQHTIVMATHLQEEVKQLCDYICLLDNGQIKDMFEKDEVQYRWARIWLSHFPDLLKDDGRVWQIEESPVQIVTNQLSELEKELQQQQIEIIHVKHLDLHEIMEYILQL
ncbi:ATP-binding cassette domain-containing protein [Gracilibacillus salitolerans]|uniref:ATP-binding cassette domain-containing protein n=1 Tax=Gracilibacillus salitolerans TaxID=2663022 RepID=A0A5Q2TGA5_9BACI|nr:ABC transporter ATP-binding protein [Gracilibacillus salitolerans]QGH32960.1 ATP-binding cassette domain-containing protein [Gracilibacillus salitolerans]